MSGVLIGNVAVTPAQPRPGETVRVEAFGTDGATLAGRTDVSVSINGVPGAARAMQFPSVGTRVVTVRAQQAAPTVMNDSATVDVLVEGEAIVFHPNGVNKPPETAMLHASQSLTGAHEIEFRIGPRPHLSLPPTTPDNHLQPAAADALVELLNNGAGGTNGNGNGSTSAALSSSALQNVMVSRPARRSNARKRTGKSAVAAIDPSQAASFISELHGALSTKYEWNFGDGTTATTTTRGVTHDYGASLTADAPVLAFDVTCRVLHEGVEVTRTLVLHSAYAICKEVGTIVPPVVADIYAHKHWWFFTADFTVTNLESQPLTITHQSVTPLGDGQARTSNDGPEYVALEHPLVLPPSSVTAVGAYPMIDGPIPYDAPGFTVLLAGHAEDGTPVRCSAVFEIPIAEQHVKKQEPQLPEEAAVAHVWPWDVVTNVIDEVVQPVANPGITRHVDSVAGLIAISVARSDYLDDATLRLRVGEAALAGRAGAVAQAGPMKALAQRDGPPAPGPIAEGEICEPDNVTEAQQAVADQQQLVCQLTTEEMDVLMPGRFMNARKGDVVLSPGGTGLIGSLLRMVDPPQRYSHSGMMTRNYDEITHSTASEDRIMDYKVGFTADGSDGFRSDVVKWMWPGVVRQSVESAVNGESFPDPESGKSYSISSFSPHAVGASHNDDFEIVPPVVVKPDPMIENTTPSVRTKLHSVAEGARAIGGTPGVPSKSHYRLFCYTDPTIGLTDSAPAETGWATGTFPTVCSSFVWMMNKAANVSLETTTAGVMPQDLEQADIDAGAQVVPGTPDGLYHYTQSERVAAGEWLFDRIHYEAFDVAGWFGEAFTDAADDTANQICNLFANDTPDKDSEDWRDTGDANAVSPDNILFWDGPDRGGLYGFAEPLIYREPRHEKFLVSRWKKVVAKGTVRVKVTLDGATVDGAVVNVGPYTTHTVGPGEYETNELVGFGSYWLNAHKTIEGVYHEVKKVVTVDQEFEHFDVALQPPEDKFRLAQLFIQFTGNDGPGPGDDENPDVGPEYYELEVGPDKLTNSKHLEYTWGGELRAEYDIGVALLFDKSIQVNINSVLFEGTDEDTDDLDGQGSISFNVPAGQALVGVIHVMNDDEDEEDDWSNLVLTAKNEQNNN